MNKKTFIGICITANVFLDIYSVIGHNYIVC